MPWSKFFAKLATAILGAVTERKERTPNPAPEPEKRGERGKTPEGFTTKQAAYITARRAGLEPTPAARAAGYSAKSAAQIAHSCEMNPRIVTAIKYGGDFAEGAENAPSAGALTRLGIRKTLESIVKSGSENERMRAAKMLLDMDAKEPKCAVCPHDPYKNCGACETAECKACCHEAACKDCEHKEHSMARFMDMITAVRAEEAAL